MERGHGVRVHGLWGGKQRGTPTVRSAPNLPSPQVDWTEDVAMRACCDPTAHMCRCAPSPEAYPKREGITFHPKRGRRSHRSRSTQEASAEPAWASAAARASAAAAVAASQLLTVTPTLTLTLP